MTWAGRKKFSWRLRTRSLALGERTLLMAIANVTPDSFSGDGLLPGSTEGVARQVVALLDGGADIVDLGAESTRPNATPLSAAAEQRRLLPVLEAVLAARPAAVLSVDTYHAETARAAAALGAEIINDVSGGAWDHDMLQAMAESGCGVVLMHTRGRPQQWAAQTPLSHEGIGAKVAAELGGRIAAAVGAGVVRDAIVIDPGFGFGKRGAENFALLREFDAITAMSFPVLAGVSRKSFLGQAVAAVQQEAERAPGESRLHASVAAGVAAVLAGAHMLRVHDLQPAREACAIADALLLSAGPTEARPTISA